MHIIRVYYRPRGVDSEGVKLGGLCQQFNGVDAEEQMKHHFNGDPEVQGYLVLR
jgi:hypothetical protein